MADAIAFKSAPRGAPQYDDSYERPMLINRLDTQNYDSQPLFGGGDVKHYRRSTGDLPVAVPEKLSRAEYSEFETP